MRQVIIRKSAPLLLPILCLFAAGCAPDDFANTNSNDPLYGAAPPPRPPVAPYQPPAGAVPSLPASNPSPTLTGLTAPTPRIPTDPGVSGWQAPATPAVVLQPPQPLTTPAAPPAPVTPKAADVQFTGNVTAAPDVNALMMQLKAKGVTKWVVQPTDQGIVLTYFIAVDKDHQTHGDVPPQRDLASAMQAALDKINAAKN